MSVNLLDFIDDPAGLSGRLRADIDACSREDVEEFRLEAARRKLQRQAQRIPAVADLLQKRDLDSFVKLDDFVSVMFDDDAYKSYERKWIDTHDYAAMTRWIARFTAVDLSHVDMNGCGSLSEWCRRLEEQVDVLVCHSTGTSGTLSFVPRSRRDRELFASQLLSSFQPYDGDPVYRINRDGSHNDITFFTMAPRQMYRITKGIYDTLEEKFGFNPVQSPVESQAPEFAIAQGRMRKAASTGREAELDNDPIVVAWRDEVNRFNAEYPERLARWTKNLVDNYRGKRIVYQGTSDMAWKLTQQLQSMGVSEAFAPGSIFSLVGGVKDNTQLPPDWQEQVRKTFGADANSFCFSWGMSEINGSSRRCPAGMYHFLPTTIPLLLEPNTRNVLPRTGTQTGQLAMLELISEDSWGGMIAGDAGTIHWDRDCDCGRHGPLMEPDSIRRI
jgi:hypothetical protein